MRILENAAIALASVACLWVVFFLDALSPFNLKAYGIGPRRIDGLTGLLAAPFLHSSLRHLLSNSVALAPLLCIALTYSRKLTLEVVLIAALIGGGFTWLFGSSHTVHIGSSGVIFGLIGYLLTIGFFQRDVLALAVSLLVCFYYGSAFFSLFVVLPGVSWSGHFFGFASGVLFAWLVKHVR